MRSRSWLCRIHWCKVKPEGLALLIDAQGAALRRGCAARGKRDTRLIARADKVHQPRGHSLRERRDCEDGRRGEAQGLREVFRPKPCDRICARMRKTTTDATGGGGVGMRRSAANAPRATVGCTDPTAERTAAKRGGARSGRPRRQSRDCRAGRTQAPTPLFVPGVTLGRYCTQIRKHSISER